MVRSCLSCGFVLKLSTKSVDVVLQQSCWNLLVENYGQMFCWAHFRLKRVYHDIRWPKQPCWMGQTSFQCHSRSSCLTLLSLLCMRR